MKGGLNINIFELYATIGLKDDGFKSGINQAKENTGGFTSSVKNLISTVAGIKVVSAAFQMVSNSIGGAVERYDTLNRFPKVLQLMGFSAADASTATDKLSTGIQGLPTSLNDIVSNAQKLTVLTGNLEESTDTTLALNNAMIASGATTTDVTRGTTQYVQMLSKGKADVISWRTLQETMGFALREVSTEMLGAGASSNDLYDALKSGQITFDQMNAKLVELSTATGGFADMAKEASGGIGTSWTNMQIAITRGVTNIISSIDKNLTENSLPNLQQSIEIVGKGFEGFLNIIANGAGFIIKTAAPAIKFIGKNLDIIVPSLAAVTAGFVAYNAAMGIANTIKKVTSAIELSKNAMAAANAVTGVMTISLGANATAEATRAAAKKAGMTIDAAGNIITAAGTAATAAETAQLLASTGAVTVKTIALGVLSGTTGIATAAALLFNAAWKANPIGVVIAGITALSAAVAGLIVWLNRESEASRELKAENENLASATDELYDSLEASSAAYDNSVKSIDAEIAASEKLADKVTKLVGVENRSAEQKSELRAYVNALNDSMQDLNLEYDYETDTLNMSTEAIYIKIKAYKEQAKAQAAQDRYTEILKEQIEVEEQLINAQKQLQDVETAYYTNSEISHKEYKNRIEEITVTEKQLQDQKESLATSSEYVENVMVDSYKAEAEAAENSVISQISAYDDLSEALQASADIIIGSMQSVADSSTSMTKQLELDSEITAQSVLDTLKNNQTMVSGYYDGLKTLMERGVQGSVIDILSDGSEESMSIVSAFKDATDEELRALVESYETNAYLAGEGYKEYLLSTGMDEATANAIYDAYLAGNEASISADWGGIGSGAANEVVTNFKESADITPAVNGIVDPFGNLFNAALSNVGLSSGEALADQTGAGASGTSAALSSPLAQAVKTASDFAVNMASSVKPGLSQLNDSFTASFTQLNSVVRNGMQSFSTMVTTATTSTFSKMVLTATNNMTTFKTNVVTKTSETATSVSNTLDNIVKTVTTWGTSLATAGKDAAERLKSSVESTASTISLYQTGVDAVQGFINGASSQEGNLYNRMYNLFYQAKKAAANALDEHSPSRELAKSGINAVLGFIQGAVSRENELYDTMENMFSFNPSDFIVGTNVLANAGNERSAFTTAAPANNGNSGDTTINQYLQAAPASAGEQADATLAAFRRARWSLT